MSPYEILTEKSLKTGTIELSDIRWIMESPEVEILPLLQAAYQVRYHYFQKNVRIHVINNVKSGNCSENCSYCSQSKDSENEIEKYPMKKRQEILEEAQQAHEGKAFRYCMVFSGSQQNDRDIEFICDVVKEVKDKYQLEVCVSAGFLNEEKIQKLRDAGVNRYNHNLNTSENHYGNICTSHQYKDRFNTIKTAKANGLEVCSGIIVGMGESVEDLHQITRDLKAVDVKSVPINFFIPVEGHRIKNYQKLTPEYCLKVLSIFRLALPSSEIRSAGGREYHIRGLQSLVLYPCNSIFAKGYLTTGGDGLEEARNMIEDAGFRVERIEY